MNFLITAPEWAAWLLGLLLLAAAAEDAVRMRISNWITLLVVLLAMTLMIRQGMALYMWQNVALFAALLTAGTLLFATGKFGGGDVKLLAAVGLWVNFRDAPILIASIFITGGVLALLILTARAVTKSTNEHRIMVLRRKAGIPYGIAIAIGALIVMIMRRSASLLT